MKWKPIKKMKKVDMFATVTLHSFTINSAATSEIIKIFGSHKYDLQLMTSDCENYIAVKPVPSERDKINPQKTVTSSPVYDLIKRKLETVSFSSRFKLKSDGEVLYFKIKVEE